MPTPTSSEVHLIFLGVMVLAVIIAVVYCVITGRGFWEKIQQQLQTRGYAISHARQRHRGPVTWVWGRYSTPVPFYLHVSNRDPVSTMAGQWGIKDIKVGHPAFDADFVVRSNQPEWAKAFLTPELCDRLVPFESLQFITSSIGNLLTPDYWPGVRERDLRDLWMLRTDGKIEEPDVGVYVDLAQELSTSLKDFCRRKTHSIEDCRSEAFEGA